MKMHTLTLLVVAALALGGCSSTGQSRTSVDAAGAGIQGGSSGPTGHGSDDAAGADARALAAGAGGIGNRRVVHFDFDSDEIRADQRPVVEQWGRRLAANPGQRLRLEGHADERGTPEYNLGLGERRALSVRRELTRLGASQAQLQVLSFGEERPLETGHDETSWQVNRRVELVD